MKNKRGYIFDLDGTLLNSLADIGNSLNSVLQKHALPVHSLDQYRHFVGSGMKILVERATPELADREEVLNNFFYEYANRYCEASTLYEGVLPMLQTLAFNQNLLAICTNKKQEYTDKIIQHYLPKINFISVIGDRFDGKQKPDPYYALYIAQQMHLSVDQIYFVGDSNIDMETAKNAGMKPIGVSWGFRSREELIESGALVVIDYPNQLVNLEL